MDSVPILDGTATVTLRAKVLLDFVGPATMAPAGVVFLLGGVAE
jgi:hypothetical protein